MEKRVGPQLGEGAFLEGRYRLHSELGSGGFGVTWLAEDQMTSSEVVVKQLRLWRYNDWKALELFEREADTLRRLEHPAIPRYIDSPRVGKSNGVTRAGLGSRLGSPLPLAP